MAQTGTGKKDLFFQSFEWLLKKLEANIIFCSKHSQEEKNKQT
jgi:hypothetical protein